MSNNDNTEKYLHSDSSTKDCRIHYITILMNEYRSNIYDHDNNFKKLVDYFDKLCDKTEDYLKYRAMLTNFNNAKNENPR